MSSMDFNASDQSRYRHTQIGWVLIVALGAAVLFIASPLRLGPPGLARTVVLSILILALVNFATLTVKVNDKEISLSFGPGLIRKRFSLADIQSWRTVKLGWTAGWGIRWIGGWLYNVSGLQAVELMRRNGRRTWIGTNQPKALEDAIRYAKVSGSRTRSQSGGLT